MTLKSTFLSHGLDTLKLNNVADIIGIIFLWYTMNILIYSSLLIPLVPFPTPLHGFFVSHWLARRVVYFPSRSLSRPEFSHTYILHMALKTLNYHSLVHTQTVRYGYKYYRKRPWILTKGRSTVTSATAHQDSTTAVFKNRPISNRAPDGAQHQG
jgi:hypothetical protein